MKKICITTLIIVTFITTGISQVIELQEKLLVQYSGPDTCISLVYFNKVDSVLLEKIDSFDLYLSQKKYESDADFFYEIIFRKIDNKQVITLCYLSQYHDYLMISNSLNSRYKKSPFAFFFYRNKLIICSGYSKKLELSKESNMLLKNLVYEKKLIKTPPLDGVLVQSKPVKLYYLE
jgi:hypothetical protein